MGISKVSQQLRLCRGVPELPAGRLCHLGSPTTPERNAEQALQLTGAVNFGTGVANHDKSRHCWLFRLHGD